MSDERGAWPFPRSPSAKPTDLRIFDPSKVRAIVEAKDAEIAALRAEVEKLRGLVQRALDLHDPDEAKVRPYGRNAHVMKIAAVYKAWNTDARAALQP
jgi:hypothetical protein